MTSKWIRKRSWAAVRKEGSSEGMAAADVREDRTRSLGTAYTWYTAGGNVVWGCGGGRDGSVVLGVIR